MSTVATAPTPARPPATCQSRPSACLDECMRRCSSGFSMRPSLRIFFSGGFKGWPCFTCLVAARGGGRHRNSLCDILLRLPACTSRRVGRAAQMSLRRPAVESRSGTRERTLLSLASTPTSAFAHPVLEKAERIQQIGAHPCAPKFSCAV